MSIIALLAGLLFPVLSAARETGKAAKCLTQMRSIGQGVTLYASDYDGHLPLSSYTTGNAFSSANWITTLIEYGVPELIRRCPSDPTDRLSSYLTNDYLEPAGADYSRLITIPRPSATAYAAEANNNYLTDHLHAYLDSWSLPTDMVSEIAVVRHQETSNLIYLDGHAAAMPWATAQATFNSESLYNPIRIHRYVAPYLFCSPRHSIVRFTRFGAPPYQYGGSERRRGNTVENLVLRQHHVWYRRRGRSARVSRQLTDLHP